MQTSSVTGQSFIRDRFAMFSPRDGLKRMPSTDHYTVLALSVDCSNLGYRLTCRCPAIVVADVVKRLSTNLITGLTSVPVEPGMGRPQAHPKLLTVC